jgi:glycerate dehydrogenase
MRGVFLDYASLGPSDIDITPLTEQLPGLELFPETAPHQVTERVSDAEVVIVNKVRLDGTMLRKAEDLRIICLAATGTDNISLPAARELGIAVCNIRAYCTPSVIQHVFSLILNLTNHLREYDQLIRNKAWSSRSEFCLLDFSIRELHGKTLGIIGLGTLGAGVARVAEAFGMRVIAARRPNDPRETAPDHPVERVEFRELLGQADIVSLHCPLTDETVNLINAETLKLMRQDAILINTARGGLIDSAALVNALRENVIGGAGIDVLRQEPPTDPDPIIDTQLPNLIVTPHIAWAAREARQRAVDEIAANIASFRNHERRNRVD